MKKIVKILVASLLILMTAAVFTSCGKKSGDAGSKGKVKLVYVEWARAIAHVYATAAILEDMGYEVEVNSVAVAAMWQSVAVGDSDALLCAWLPVTHADHYAKFKDEFEDLGPNYTGAKLGLVVPSYVTINSIEELPAYIDKFDGKITGIDPGAGMSKAIDKAIADDMYGLSKFEHVAGSDATMAAALKDAISRKEWMVVPLWQPHWIFGALDLKFLDDPEGMFGEEETINTIVKKGLKDEKPEVYNFLKTFPWAELEGDLSKLLVENKNSPDDPAQNAKAWYEANKDKIKGLMK